MTEHYTIEDLRDFLRINKADLDNEIVQQPTLFYIISERYANAVSLRDAAYEKIKQIDSSLDSRIRQEMIADGDKITEGKVAAAVQVHQEHVDAHQFFLDQKLEAETIGALRDAFHQRSYMLRDLVQLYMANYYMEDSVNSGRQQSREKSYTDNKGALANARRERKSLRK